MIADMATTIGVDCAQRMRFDIATSSKSPAKTTGMENPTIPILVVSTLGLIAAIAVSLAIATSIASATPTDIATDTWLPFTAIVVSKAVLNGGANRVLRPLQDAGAEGV